MPKPPGTLSLVEYFARLETAATTRAKAAERKWKSDPRGVFKDLSTYTCKAIDIVVNTYDAAAQLQDDVLLSSLPEANRAGLLQNIEQAGALYFTEARDFLERDKSPVYLNRRDGHQPGIACGTCYTELAICFVGGVLRWIYRERTAFAFRKELRLQTAGGNRVGYQLLSLSTAVRSEIAGAIADWELSKHRASTTNVTNVPSNIDLIETLRKKYPRWRLVVRDMYFLTLRSHEQIGDAEIRDRCISEHPEWRLPPGNAGRQRVESARKRAAQKLKKSGLSA